MFFPASIFFVDGGCLILFCLGMFYLISFLFVLFLPLYFYPNASSAIMASLSKIFLLLYCKCFIFDILLFLNPIGDRLVVEVLMK